ncbi:MAG: type IV toxin-antitoxin system AbiEi family antitoxin [bacterium]
MPTEKEIIEQLQRGEVALPPLSFRFLGSDVETDGNSRLDALVEISWRGSVVKFAIECKALSTPKAFQNAVNMLKSLKLPKDYRPMLLVPFLTERQLQDLEQEGISGIDLCGNGVVVDPGKLSVFRTGGKNRFPSSAAIKNIYRKNSSMVGRVFLARSVYGTVQDIRAEINQRNLLVDRWDRTPMSLSTVSKALKTLEQDLIIERGDNIRLLQPEKLLEKLRDNYEPPYSKERISLKVREGNENIRELLFNLSQTLNLPLVATGLASVNRYAVMQRGDMLSVYCPRVEMLLEELAGDQTDRFPDIELIETVDEKIYFDARQEGEFRWASPVQVYLELMAGDKRDQETAEQVKSVLLRDLELVG